MEPVSSRGMPVWLLLLGVLGAIIGFCWSEQDYVAATALAAMGLAGFWGYYVGVLRLVGLFSGLAMAYACASPVGQWFAPHIAKGFETSPSTTRLISLVAGGGIVLLAVTVTMAIVTRRLLRDRPHIQAANRWLGFGVGALQGAAAMLLLLNGILMIEPHAKQRIQAGRNHDGSVLARAVAKRVVDIAERTRRSTIASLVHAYNPFERLPQLRNLQRALVMVSNPEIQHNGLQSPAGEQRPMKSEVRRAIESLAQDPQLRKLAQSKQPLDKQTAVSLLNHPGIAKLLEHPDLMKQLTEAMDDLGVQPMNDPRR